eukprot:2256571-Pyramimonas_sp.AAC.2
MSAWWCCACAVFKLNKLHRHNGMHPLAMALMEGKGGLADDLTVYRQTAAIEQMKRGDDDTFHLIVEEPPAPMCEGDDCANS